MDSTIPSTAKQWNVTATDGYDSLKFSEQPVPELGDSEVLVKMQAASINYRDIIIPIGQYPFPVTPNVVPGSDGAGTVLAIGRQVTRFKPGDRVITLFNQAHIGGPSDDATSASGLGGVVDGTFRTVGAFNETGLVHMPSTLTAVEASTLTCAGLTAWNALYGLVGKQIAAGQWVLTQGTGGVSIFGLQFAKAAGARVIATTGSSAKAEMLRKLGADHVINYKETPNWGETAKKLTGGRGVDHIIEVAGPSSMKQSLAAIKIEGVISIIGFVGGGLTEAQPGFLECLMHQCIARGILVGSRTQMEDMCRAIEAHPETLKPLIDAKVFPLEQLKEALQYQLSAQHLGKVCIEIS